MVFPVNTWYLGFLLLVLEHGTAICISTKQHTSSSSQTWGHTLSNQQGEQPLYFLGITLQHYPQVMESQITILDAGDDKILKAFLE